MSTLRPALVFAIAAGLAAASARADVIDASFTELATGRADPRDGQLHTVVPAYQIVSLRASAIRNPLVDDLNLVLSGWGSLDLAEVREDSRGTGDLDLGFAEGKLLDKRLRFRAGRQIVFGGAVRAAQMDGLDLDVGIAGGAGANGYAGVPVVPRFATRQGDFMTGGRLYWRPAWDMEFGASYAYVLDGGRAARSDAGVDGHWLIGKGFSATGAGFWSLVENRLSEARLAASWARGDNVLVSLDARRTAPDLFIFRGSLFSVFAEEKRDEAGGLVYWKPLSRLGLTGDYHFIAVGEGDGHRTGLRADVELVPGGGARAGVEARLLTVPANGYRMGRVFVTARPLAPLLIAADASAYMFDVPVNGESSSITGALTAAWQITRSWQAVVTGIGGQNPWLERRFEVIGRLVYSASLHVREEGE